MKEDLDFVNILKLYIEIYMIFSDYCLSNYSDSER